MALRDLALLGKAETLERAEALKEIRIHKLKGLSASENP